MDMAAHDTALGLVPSRIGCEQPRSSVVFFFVRCFVIVAIWFASLGFGHADERGGIYNPLHGYETRPAEDRFTRFLKAWDAGESNEIDTSGDLPFLRSLLKELEIPVSSQMMVFTATSLQKGLISARNPRALYFNDDTYVGFVPRGKIEVISLDPTLGGVFYIFDRLQPGRRPQVQRSMDCMNCHAPRHMDNIPGLVIESVLPGMTGGGERAFRRQLSGHSIPLADRFAGWHLTGTGPAMPHHWGNKLLLRKNGEANEVSNLPGERSDLSRYLLPTSDLLAQLLHEHQSGFANRSMQASYRYHELNAAGGVSEIVLDELAAPLVRYLLFADEAPLVPGMIGESPLAAEFSAGGRRDSAGNSLRDLDGQTKLLRHRCSYMIYSPAFTGLPAPLRERVVMQLAAALDGNSAGAHLPAEERAAIRQIVTQTVPEFSSAKN
jgi:hypothetical protein